MRKLLRAFAGAGIAAAMVVLTGPAASAAVDTNRQPQVLIGVGSDTTYELMNDLDQVYNESPGCAIIPTSGTFTNFGQKCLTPGTLSYAINYSDLIETENLYHDMVTEAAPVGSGNGTTVLTESLKGTAGATLGADFNRRSSSTTTSTIGTAPYDFKLYETGYALDGLGVWVGKNNTLVYTGGTTTAKPTFLKNDLLNVWEPDGASSCFVKWSNVNGDSIGTLKVATTAFTDSNGDGIKDKNGGNIVLYATQAGSGTGNSFDAFIRGVAQSSGVAANLQGCIPPQFKNGVLGDGEHVIFENIANPICAAKTATGALVNDRAKAIFPYSIGRFTQNAGSTAGPCLGVLGKLDTDSNVGTATDRIAATAANVSNGSYAYTRTVFNYWPVPVCKVINDQGTPGDKTDDTCTTTYAAAGFGINSPSTWDQLPDRFEAILEYLHPTLGWLCKDNADHSNSPVTSQNYATIIKSTTEADGFGRLSSAPVGGSTFSGSSFCRSNS